MRLVILTAVLAVCGAAKLDRSYLPPPSAKTAGGSPGALLAPEEGLPSGSYTNDAQGVVVDAAAPGTRTSGGEPTGLGGPRTSYGSTNSKVGDAAFSRTGGLTRISPGFGSNVGEEEYTGGENIRTSPGFRETVASQGSNNDKTHASTLKFSNNVGVENYSYGFETDNGIAIGENGVAADGVKAQGGYSYKGDDGKVYSVSYTADEEGYKPFGSHLPTPPPIPEAILKSLERNAKEEAAGIVDDGSYDARKYNNDGAYTSNNNRGNNRQAVSRGATAGSGAFNHQANSKGIHGVDNHQVGFAQSSHGHGTSDFQTTPYSHNLEFHSHSSQKQFDENPSNNNQGSVSGNLPTFQKNTSQRLPGNLNSNAVYSSAAAAGSDSATAFASNGDFIPHLKGQFSSVGQIPQFKAGSHSSGVNHIPPTSASASVSVQGPDTSVEPIFKNQKLNQNDGYLPPRNIFGSAPQTSHSSLNLQAGSTSVPSSAPASGQQANLGQFSSASIPTTQQIHKIPSKFAQSLSHEGFSSQSPSSGPGQHTQAGGANIHFSGGIHAHNSEAVSEIKPTKVPSTELTTPFEPNDVSKKTKPIFNLSSSNAQLESSTPTQSSFSKYSQQDSSQYQAAQEGSSAHSGSNSFASEFSKPTLNVQHGTNKIFNKPTGDRLTSGSGDASSSESSSSFSNNRQPNRPISSIPNQGSKYSNTPIGSFVTPTTSTQNQGTTGSFNYNGITQASISPFPSAVPTASTQFKSHSNQFEAKPTMEIDDSSFIQTQFQSTGNQHGLLQNPVTDFGQKPIAQSQLLQSSQQTSSQTQAQAPQQGTIYEYNKPFTFQESISKHVSSSQTGPQSKPGGISLSNHQSKPFGSSFLSSPLQQTQTYGSTLNSQFTTQVVQKPFPTIQSQSTQFSQNENNQNPASGTIYEYNKPTSHKEIASTSTQLLTKPGHHSFGSQSAQLINQQNKPLGSNTFSFQQSQNKGSSADYENTDINSHKPQLSQSSGPVSAFQSQFGQSQLSSKPIGSTHTGSTFQQTPFVSPSASQSAENPITQSESSFEQTQFSSFGSHFEQKPITGQTDNSSRQQNQGTLYEYNKPTENLSSEKESLSLSSVPQFVQNSPVTSGKQGLTQVSNKPVSSSKTDTIFHQTQTTEALTVGSQAINQFGGKPPKSHIAGFSNSQPGSTFQQTQLGSKSASQFGQKPTSALGSSFASSQDQTSQFVSKPNLQAGTLNQQQQFGTFPSHFDQKLTQESHLISNAFSHRQKSPLSQNPLSDVSSESKFQQTQYGLNFGQMPQSNQGTNFASYSAGANQYFKKPLRIPSTNDNSLSQTQASSLLVSQDLPKIQSSELNLNSQSQTPFGQETNSISQTGTILQQRFESSIGFPFGQKSQTTITSSTKSKDQSIQTDQFDQKPFGNSQVGSFSQKKGFQFGQIAQKVPSSFFTPSTSSSIEVSQLGVKPFNSPQDSGASVFQTEFGNTSQFGQLKPQLGKETISTTAEDRHTSQYKKIPLGLQNAFQKNQFNAAANSQFSQSGQTQFGLKPISSSQNAGSTFQKLNSPFESFFGQSPSALGSQTLNSAFSQSSQLQYGTKPRKPIDNTQAQFGSFAGQKPQSSASAFASSFPFGSSETGQLSKIQPSTFGTVGTQVQKPVAPSTTQQNKPFSSQFNAQSQKPFANLQANYQHFQQTETQNTLGSQRPIFQDSQFDSLKSKPSQDPIHTTITSDSSQSLAQLSDREDYNGYNYQKPQGTITSFGEHSKPVKTKPVQTHFGSHNSHTPFNNSPLKPAAFNTYVDSNKAVADSRETIQSGNYPGSQGVTLPPFGSKLITTGGSGVTPTVGSTQFGVKPSSQISLEQLQSTKPTYQLTDKPTQSTFYYSQQPSQTSQPLSGSIASASAQSTASDTPASLGLTEDSSNEGSSVSTVQTPVSDNKVVQSQNSFVGKGEDFGGPRDPPRFDDKTGYHY